MTKRALSTKDPTTKRPVLKFSINTVAMVFSSNELLVEILERVSTCEQYRLFALINKNTAAIARDPLNLYSAMQKFAFFCETGSEYCEDGEYDELSIKFSFCFDDDPCETRYTSFWKDRQRNGVDEKTYSSGRVLQLPWKDGELDGTEEMRDADNGLIMYECQWENGLKHGDFRTYYPNGSLKDVCSWCEGKKSLQETRFGPVSKIYECDWVFGQKHGMETWFDKGSDGWITPVKQLCWEHGREL